MKRLLLLIWLLLCSGVIQAANNPWIDSLKNALYLPEQQDREKKTVASLQQIYLVNKDFGARNAVKSLLDQLPNEWREDYAIIADNIYLMALKTSPSMTKTSREVEHLQGKHYLLYILYYTLASTHAENGHPVQALSFFRLASNEAMTNHDRLATINIDIGLSDVLYKVHLYDEALFYLNEATELAEKEKETSASTLFAIYFNKADIFFQRNKVDSLEAYTKLVCQDKFNEPKNQKFILRAKYFVLVARKQYDLAIPAIHEALNAKPAYENFKDKSELAKVYMSINKLKIADSVLTDLENDKELTNRPMDYRNHLLLHSQLKRKTGNFNEALDLSHRSLGQGEIYLKEIMLTNSMLASFKLDSANFGYTTKKMLYERNQLLLMLVTMVVALLFIAFLILYWSIRNKRRYEQLLFSAKKNELAIINSHQVRKPLANLLGLTRQLNSFLVDEESQNLAFAHLQTSAEELDGAIRNISEKLSAKD